MTNAHLVGRAGISYVDHRKLERTLFIRDSTIRLLLGGAESEIETFALKTGFNRRFAVFRADFCMSTLHANGQYWAGIPKSAGATRPV